MTSKAVPDIGHKIGEQNIRVFNLDIHNPVFIVSAALVVMLVIGTLLFLEQAATLFADLRIWTTTTFDWFYFAASNLFVLFCFGIALSPLGRIRLGGKLAKPEYGYSAWLAMLFAAGVGIGLMFFGVLEPVTHTLAPPLGIDPPTRAQHAPPACPRRSCIGACMHGRSTQWPACRWRSSASIAACR